MASTIDSTDAVNNGIPVLTLTIDPDEFQKVVESEQHSYRSYGGSISISVPDGYTGKFSDTELEGISNASLEYFRGRGNSTWAAEKKPFKLKLNESANLLGLGKGKHWVLMANAFDYSFLRNRLTCYIARRLGMDSVPKMLPVDFVVNGEYQGSYVLSQQVRVGKGSVDIDELKANDVAKPEITGGYLLAMRPYGDEADINKFTTSRVWNSSSTTPISAT